MTRIFLLTKNAFRSILHARSLYLWLLAVLLIAVRLLPLLLIPNPTTPPPGMNPAIQSRFAEAIKNRRPNSMAGGLNDWSVLCIVFGILVGANALATEVTAKTIITTLARPVLRWELLFGKWIAIQLFAIVSLAIGLVLFKAAAAYFEVTFSSIVWMALAHALVATMLYSAIAIAFSTVISPAVSGAIAVLLAFLPGFVTFLLDDTGRFRHALGVALDYIVPPGYSNLYAYAVRAGTILDYSAQSKALFENLGYGAVFFVLGCLVFTKREIRLG
jgi:ABC-type transport system involved in multi-copper enzyme maturation permease subunit